MELTVNVDGAAAIQAQFARGPAAVDTAALASMRRIARRLHKDVHDTRISGQMLGVRTGTTRRALFQRVFVQGDTATAVVGVDGKQAPGARANEFGATIRPTRGQYLTVPIGEALTPKGVARFTARALIQNPAAVGYVGSFVAKEIIFGKKANGTIEPLFALKRQVVLKKVGYLEAARNDMDTWLPEETKELLEAAVTVLGGGGERG